MMTKRILARDRRLAAIHEAGHIVIARMFGFKIVSAWIARHDDAGPDEKTWCGCIQIESARGADNQSRRMVGVAGDVAEHLWLGGWIEDYFPEGLSESDWRLTGCDPDQHDDAFMDAIEKVGQLFSRDGPHWQALIAEARRLIVASRPTA